MCYYVIINTINKKTIKFMAILSKKERHFMNTKLRKYTRIYLFLTIILLLLARMHFFNIGFVADQKTISDLEGKKCTLTLRVASIPKYTMNAVSFNAEVQDGIDISSMLRVRIKNGERLGITCGDTVKLICEPRIADGAMNKGCFDYNSYLKSQGVCAAAYSGIEYIKDIKNGKMHNFYAKRSMLTEKIFKYLPYDEASLVNALVTGSKDEMPDDIKEMFRRSGTYHVVAVSGLHLNILVLFRAEPAETGKGCAYDWYKPIYRRICLYIHRLWNVNSEGGAYVCGFVSVRPCDEGIQCADGTFHGADYAAFYKAVCYS